VTRTLPKYVNGYLDRHGKPRHYVRLRGRKKMPLPGLPWSREFMEAYDAALNQSAPVIVIGASRSPPGTVAEAVARYLGSATFTNNFKPATQAMRRAVLNRFRNEHGDKRIGKLEPQYVSRLVSRLRPYAQRNMLKTLRGSRLSPLARGVRSPARLNPAPSSARSGCSPCPTPALRSACGP
jgi:hypothetical protein